LCHFHASEATSPKITTTLWDRREALLPQIDPPPTNSANHLQANRMCDDDESHDQPGAIVI